MAWSEDTRCLYCEGRLPLYRKITHGQFCSSAHRKAYWEEQERLAVERLHQSHHSLHAHRPSSAEDLNARLSQVEVPRSLPEAAPAPLLEEAALPIPDLSGCLWPDVPTCYSCSLHFIETEPCEYEIALNPFTPSVAWSSPETKPFALGETVPIVDLLAPRNAQGASAPAAFTESYGEIPLYHPASGVHSPEIRIASRVGLPLVSGSGSKSFTSANHPSIQPVEAELAPATNVTLKIAPQGDLLVELLDQQVPHPESLLALSAFAAHAPVVTSPGAQVDSRLEVLHAAALPAAVIPAVIPDYQLVPAGKRLFSDAVSPAAGKLSSAATVLDTPLHTDTAICYGSMPQAAGLACQVGSTGLQSLASTLRQPVPGDFALKSTDKLGFDLSGRAAAGIAFPTLGIPAGALGAESPVVDIGSQIGTAGLCPLPSSVLKPTQGRIAPQADGMTWDLCGAVSSDVTLPQAATGVAALTPRAGRILPLRFANFAPAESAPQSVARLIPQSPEPHPVLPASKLEPMDRKPAEDALRTNGRGLGSLVSGEGLSKLAPAWAHASGFWQHAPRDLKLLLFAIPALLALVFHPGLPRVAYAAPQTGGGFSGSLKRVLNDRFSGLRQSLENRAAIALDEDFRSGLDNWASPGGSTTEWSFDSSGFVKPGPLAIYRPSVHLADYQTQFMGTIDKKALSWVVRAADFENFYVIKLVIVKPGPIPTIGLTRYAVIGGKAQDRHDVNIPISARADTLYSIGMNVQGSNFSVEVQGQMADSWTETRLPRGGVGFFTARGEESRVRWVQITHQYDMLGRLCAYLAPLDTTNGSWQP